MDAVHHNCVFSLATATYIQYGCTYLSVRSEAAGVCYCGGGVFEIAK